MIDRIKEVIAIILKDKKISQFDPFVWVFDII